MSEVDIPALLGDSAVRAGQAALAHGATAGWAWGHGDTGRANWEHLTGFAERASTTSPIRPDIVIHPHLAGVLALAHKAAALEAGFAPHAGALAGKSRAQLMEMLEQ